MLRKISLIIAFLACGALTSWGAQQVVVMDADHGTVSVDNATVSGGDVVTITLDPQPGYTTTAADIRAEVTIDPGLGHAPQRVPQVGQLLELTEVTAGETYTFVMPEEPYNVQVSATFRAINYSINIVNEGNGEAQCEQETATVGEVITLTIVPGNGYTLELLTIIDDGGNEIAYEPVSDSTYTFKMPAGNVTVTAKFVQSSPTALDDVRLATTSVTHYYDLSGRYLGTTLPPGHGICITQDGRKLLR
ncbi:MAG: hypothetical protein IKX39_01305 [Muribaculaceae bacterium]|nr:hypothetical protein [Muribaculaceae bacterium]